MILAIFDLDDTLTLQDTESLWQAYLVYKNLIPEDLYLKKRAEFQESYSQGTLSFEEVIRFSLGPLSALSKQEQEALRHDFQKDWLRTIIFHEAIDLVRHHKAKNHKILILSAGHEWIVPLAAEYFHPDQVLCTQLEKRSDGGILPILKGPPLFQEQKIHALKQWLENNSLSTDLMYFYSDSINDLPLLEYVQYPCAVNPCKRLRPIAQARQWPILDFDRQRVLSLQNEAISLIR